MWPFWYIIRLASKAVKIIFLLPLMPLIPFPTHPFSLSSLCVCDSSGCLPYNPFIRKKHKFSACKICLVSGDDILQISLKSNYLLWQKMNCFEAKYDFIVGKKRNGQQMPQNARDPFSPRSSTESTVMRL